MPTREKTKPFKTFEEQVDILISRGLIVSDKKVAINALKKINYYRLSAYSLTLRKDNKFYPGTTIENIIQLYYFDAALRNLILTYVPFIENTFRTYISYYHSQKYGPLGYLNSQNFISEWYHAIFLSKLKSLIDRSNDVFIKHHKEDRKGIYPFWVAIEVTTFDVISKFYKNMLPEDKNAIAKKCFCVSREYIENWLQCSVIARNISAHGGRFYNRKFDFCKVKLPAKMQDLVSPSSTFSFIFAIYNLLPSEDIKNKMLRKLNLLFREYPFARLNYVGFPSNWEKVLVKFSLICKENQANEKN